MKVYVVMAGWYHVGLCAEDMKVFEDKSKAEQYGEELVEKNSYDYYEVLENQIN